MKNKHIAALILILPMLLLGCTTLTQSQDAALVNIASTAATLAEQYAGGGHPDYAQALPVLISSAATFAPHAKIDSQAVSDAVQKAVADGTVKGGSTATKLAAVIGDTLPAVVTGIQANKAIAAAATGASSGANQPAK